MVYIMDMTRRRLLGELSSFALSTTALSFAMGASRADAVTGYDPREDIFYLNKALAKEHNVIMSYDFSIETGLFEKIAFESFNFILTDHNRHKDLITGAIAKLGGDPVQPPSREEFRKGFDAELIRTGSDALRFNLRFEVESYVVWSEIATYIKDPTLVSMSANCAADEAIHRAILVTAKASVPFDPTLRIRD